MSYTAVLQIRIHKNIVFLKSVIVFQQIVLVV